MDVALSDDHSVGDGEFAFGTDKGTSRRTGGITRLADQTGKSDLAGVCEGKLNLGFPYGRALGWPYSDIRLSDLLP